MKVELGEEILEKVYRPITIRLNTPYEARVMYYLLNMPLGVSLEEQCKRDRVDHILIDEFKHELWKQFDKKSEEVMDGPGSVAAIGKLIGDC